MATAGAIDRLIVTRWSAIRDSQFAGPPRPGPCGSGPLPPTVAPLPGGRNRNGFPYRRRADPHRSSEGRVGYVHRMYPRRTLRGEGCDVGDVWDDGGVRRRSDRGPPPVGAVGRERLVSGCWPLAIGRWIVKRWSAIRDSQFAGPSRPGPFGSGPLPPTVAPLPGGRNVRSRTPSKVAPLAGGGT